MDQLSGSNELNSLLKQINAEGEFPISVLTDHQGLAIAWAASNGMDPERQSADSGYGCISHDVLPFRWGGRRGSACAGIGELEAVTGKEET